MVLLLTLASTGLLGFWKPKNKEGGYFQQTGRFSVTTDGYHMVFSGSNKAIVLAFAHPLSFLSALDLLMSLTLGGSARLSQAHCPGSRPAHTAAPA